MLFINEKVACSILVGCHESVKGDSSFEGLSTAVF